MKPDTTSFSALTILFLILVLMPGSELSAQNYAAGTGQFIFSDPDRNNRSISTQVYYPADQPGSNAPFSDGRFPHVVFGHGFLMAVSAYESIAAALAEEGFIVLLPESEGGIFPNHTNFARDLAFLADLLIELDEDPGSFFYEKINGKFAIGGHSMGGGCTYLSAQYLNNEAGCLFTFAAAETNPSAIAQMGQLNIPNLLFAGELDCVTPPEDHQIPIYEAQSSQSCKYYLEITGGYHCQFNDSNFNCNLGENSCSPGGGIDRQQQIDLTLELLLPWLKSWLYADCTAFDIFEDLVAGGQGFLSEWECDLSGIGDPQIGVSGDLPACPGDSIVLTATNTTGNILWSTGETSTQISVFEGGFYSYSLSNEMCSIESEAVEIVFQDEVFPEISIIGNADLCPGESVILQADPPLGNISWNDGSTDYEIETSTPGTYFYTLEIDGCSYFSTAVFIDQIEDPGLEVIPLQGAVLCQGESLPLSVSHALDAIVWNTGEEDVAILAGFPGAYFYEGTLHGCPFQSDTVFIIEDDPGPLNIELSVTLPLCPGDSILLSTDFQGSIDWSSGASGSEIAAFEEGNYYFEGCSDYCCYTSDTVEVSFYPELFPEIDFMGLPVLCPGDSIVLTAVVGDVSWSTGSEDSSITIFDPGDYYYDLLVNGCLFSSDTLRIEVVEFLDLKVIAESGSNLCPGDSVVIGNSLGEFEVLWSTGDTAGELIATEPGFYYFTAGDSACNFRSDTIQIVEIQDPDAVVSSEAPLRLCPDQTTQLFASPNIENIQWNTGDTTNLLDVFEPGTYYYVFQFENCIFSSDSALVTGIEKPSHSLEIIGDSLPCPGETVLLIASVESGSAIWNVDGTMDSLAVSEAGLYSFFLEYDGCTFQGDTIVVEFGMDYTGSGISGPDTVAAGEIHLFGVDGSDTWQYEWSANEPEIIGSPFLLDAEVFFPEGLLGPTVIRVVIKDGICIDTAIEKTVWVESAVGIQNGAAEQPIWFNGPESWRVEFQNHVHIGEAGIFDLSGRLVYQLKKLSGTEILLPHYQLRPGIYIAILKDENGLMYSGKMAKF